MTNPWISVYDSLPAETGWYPVLICWEPREGFFPDAAYWNGTEFLDESSSPRPYSHYINQPCDSFTEAEALADDNDPDW